MATVTEVNKELVNKYKVDDTILESYFKNANQQKVVGVTFPLRIDNRQYCSPTDYQGKNPSCCGFTTAQILEALEWMRTGVLKQMNANQIYAKAKETDGQMGRGGTYPDLAMQKGLDLMPGKLGKNYVVCSLNTKNVQDLKRVIHRNMFASVNMGVTKDLYNVNMHQFMYNGNGEKAGGHSLVCCGYDEPSRMFIMQNHWGADWGLKGFFLCPYDVWSRQNNIICWYERVDVSSIKSQTKEVAKETTKEVKDKVVENEPAQAAESAKTEEQPKDKDEPKA